MASSTRQQIPNLNLKKNHCKKKLKKKEMYSADAECIRPSIQQ